MDRTLHALKLALVVTPLLIYRQSHDGDRERLHETLSDFLSRGQLIVETMPPLTFLIRPIIALWPAALDWSALNIGNVIGDILLLLSGLLAFDLTHESRNTWCAPLLETIASLSVFFGCNFLDLFLCLALIQVKRLVLAFQCLKNPRSSMLSVALSLALPLIWNCLLMLGTTILIFALVYPHSESSSGGNYNLRYLPAGFRRSLRSVAEDRQQTGAIALMADRPLTLYVQNAGFLWTDSAVWDAEVLAFGQDAYVRSHAMSSTSTMYSVPEFLSHRVVFEDRIRRVSPWVFQYVSSTISEGVSTIDNKQSLMYIRNQYTGEYLTANAYVRSIIDEYTDHKWHEGFRRHFVGMSTHESDASLWHLESDGDTSKGFHLRNHASQCYLGSTFRTFPDVLADRTNDTVLHQLYMSLESACISHPTRLASTFFAVDDLSTRGTVFIHAPTGAFEFLNAAFVHAFAIVSGQYRLYRFRSLYAHLQDTPLELTKRGASLGYTGATTIVALSSVCFLLRIARTQRMNSHENDVRLFSSHGSHKKMVCNYLIGSLLVGSHLLLTALSEGFCSCRGGVCVSIAMLTIIELWKDTLLEYRLVGTGLVTTDVKRTSE